MDTLFDTVSVAGNDVFVACFLVSLSDLTCEDSPELLPPPGVSDNRQCVLCLKYGDDNTNVSQSWAKHHLSSRDLSWYSS